MSYLLSLEMSIFQNMLVNKKRGVTIMWQWGLGAEMRVFGIFDSQFSTIALTVIPNNEPTDRNTDGNNKTRK